MSEWQQVLDENENMETEFEGEIWKPEMVDEAIIGKYVDIEENVGTNNDSTLYHIRAKDNELYKVWGSKVLDSLFKKVPLNSEVKLVYKGKKQSKKGFYYKVYNLFQKGGEASASSSSDEPEVMTVKDPIEDEAMNIANEQMKKPNKPMGWFEKVQELTPKKQEDYKNKERVAAEWINMVRGDLIGNGVKPETVTPKTIRDNVVALVEDGETKDHNLGLLDEEMGKEIFKVLRIVDPV